jgi:predicted 3-demethylubiquinone-9 3-methyltransferase (glyoxalase superfamily)
LYSAPSSLAHSADLKVRQFSGRELVILHWRSIADALIDRRLVLISRLVVSDLLSGTIRAMNKLAPFLWFNDNAEEAAEFYLRVFPHARKLDELRSKGVGPWPVGKIATITIELEGQEMVFLNGGPAHQLNPAFSFFVRCDSQEEIDSYWNILSEGGKSMSCGWLTDRFGLCWQIVPRNIGDLISHPKAMEAMMGMIKMDLAALEAAREG